MQELINALREELDALSLSPLVSSLILLALMLCLIWGIQFLLRRVVVRWLRRLLARGNADWDGLFFSVVDTPMRLVVLGLSLQAIALVIDPGDRIRLLLDHLAVTLLTLALMVMTFQLISRFTLSASILFNLTGFSIQAELLPFVRTGLRLLVIVLGAGLILEQWGYSISTLVATLGIGGILIALAAQDTVSNLFAFTTIVGDRSLLSGEYISTPDVEGTVENVGLRSTRIRQLDQALVTIPNAKLAGNPIKNWSRLSRRMINFTLGVTYATSAPQMRELLRQLRALLLAHPRVEPESVRVFFTEFGASDLQVLVRCYLQIPDWVEFHTAKEEINLQVMDIVEAMGLDIAYPSQSVYIENFPPRLTDLVAQESPTRED